MNSNGDSNSNNSGVNSYYAFLDNNDYGDDPDDSDSYEGNNGETQVLVVIPKIVLTEN